MKISLITDFLNSAEGLKVLGEFNKLKQDIEDPAGLVIKKILDKPGIKNYLDIGGGDGIRTLQIAKAFECEHIDYLEPSKNSSSLFVKQAKHSYQGTYTVINKGFQDFKATKKYELITSIHSWYYIDLRDLRSS